MRPVVIFFCLFSGLWACNESPTDTSSRLPDDAVPYDPLPAYAQWWLEVIQEAHLETEPPTQVQWYRRENGPWFDDQTGELALGAWHPDGTIWIAKGYTIHEGIVKHEMLHELLQGDYDHEHWLFEKYNLGCC